MMHADTIEQQSRGSVLSLLRERTREIIGDLRQWQYPPELRIARPLPPMAVQARVEPAVDGLPESSTESSARLDRAIAKVAVCIWDIRRKLEGNQAVQQDRKLRLLNRRAESAVMAFQEMGVVIDDPIGRRYTLGSEGSMKPNLLPTEGATTEQIVETVAPIVYRDDRLIGRGEVFVAVPDTSQGPGPETGAASMAPSLEDADVGQMPIETPDTSSAPDAPPSSHRAQAEQEPAKDANHTVGTDQDLLRS